MNKSQVEKLKVRHDMYLTILSHIVKKQKEILIDARDEIKGTIVFEDKEGIVRLTFTDEKEPIN